MNKELVRNKGFTLIELIVVIAIIGILAAISIVGLNRFQGDTRDARRSSSASVIVEALEKYYDKNGEYPSCSQLTAATVTTDTLKGIDTSTVIAPQAPSGTANSIQCGDGTTLSVNGTDFFEYKGDGSVACNTGGSCLSYTLRYKDEADSKIKEIASRRNTAIATSGDITDLNATSIPFTTIKLAWSPVVNATGYTIQQSSTSASFPSDGTFVSTNSATNALTVTGLTPNTTYYYRVTPISSTGNGNWSNAVTIATQHIATPGSPNAVTNSGSPLSQIDFSWSSVAYASSYSVDYSTCSTFCSGVTSLTGLTVTSQSFTGLTAGTPYYFRVKAVAPDDTSSYATASATTLHLAAPASPSAVTNSGNPSAQIDFSWSAVSYATSYTVDYSACSTFCSGVSTSTGITGTSRSFSGLTTGTTYYFRVKALAANDVSSYSATANATTYVPVPTGLSVVDNSSSVFTESWNAVSVATKYIVQCSNDNASWGSGCQATINAPTTSFAYGGASQGARYYVRIQAVAANGTASAWSGSVYTTTTIDKPATAAMSIDTTTWATGAHHNVNYATYCPYGTTVNPGINFQGGYSSSGFSGPSYPEHYWHTWGFSDWWDRGNTIPAGSHVRYLTNYNCSTAYATSPTADTTVNYITVN